MRKFLSTLLLLASAQNVLAQDATIYRWVDSNNVVHFSHEHPTDKDYAQIDVMVSYKPTPKATEESKQEAEQQVATDTEQAFTSNCKLAKDNLKALNENERIMMKDADGNARLLSDEEKKMQVEINTKQAEVYCKETDIN